jgi:hypothetical protein
MATKGNEIVNPRTGQRMKFLRTGRGTNGELWQTDCINPPGGVKEPEHIHLRQENRFEVISGSLRFSIAGQERQINAGEFIVTKPPKIVQSVLSGMLRPVAKLLGFQRVAL